VLQAIGKQFAERQHFIDWVWVVSDFHGCSLLYSGCFECLAIQHQLFVFHSDCALLYVHWENVSGGLSQSQGNMVGFKTGRTFSLWPLPPSSSDADQALDGVDEHPTFGHCRCAVRDLTQGVSCQYLESVRGFHHNHLSFGRDAKQPPIHPDGRAKIIAANTLLPFHFA
jgi:hypothetical protein